MREVEELAEKNLRAPDPEKAKAAQALKAKIDEVLSSGNHKWFLNQMDPEEAARRKKDQEEFQRRYEVKS